MRGRVAKTRPLFRCGFEAEDATKVAATTARSPPSRTSAPRGRSILALSGRERSEPRPSPRLFWGRDRLSGGGGSRRAARERARAAEAPRRRNPPYTPRE